MRKPKPRRVKLHECLTRAIRLLVYLCDHRFGGTLTDLAEEAGITQRQLYHYLEAFERAGVPVERTDGCRWSGPGRAKLRDRRWIAQKLGILEG